MANDSFGGSNERKKHSRFVCDTTQHVNEEIPTSYYGGLLLMNAVTEGREKERERERERERDSTFGKSVALGKPGVFKSLERRLGALLLDDIQKRLTPPREARRGSVSFSNTRIDLLRRSRLCLVAMIPVDAYRVCIRHSATRATQFREARQPR